MFRACSLALLVLAPSTAQQSIDIDTDTDKTNSVCLLQKQQQRPHRRLVALERPQSCVPLDNRGTYFSLPVCVGTPPQCFDVVADTGSNSVIVPSCICGETPGSGCEAGEKCFRGTNKSSTFEIAERTPILALTFGSGTIQVAPSTDVVQLGNISTKMEDGVLLMTNRAQLNIAGEFEGILGLGIPPPSMSLVESNGTTPDDVFRELRNRFRSVQVPVGDEIGDEGSDSISQPEPTSPVRPSRPRNYQERLFLQEANVDRFTMCFRDMNQPGVLRLDVPPFPAPIAQIGKMHWGMDFRGLSVGDKGLTGDDVPSELVLCSPETMTAGMKSPCGLIPDSGTTLIMAPSSHIAQLESSICKRWPRCSKELENAPAAEVPAQSMLFRRLLQNCSSWLTEAEGLYELPSLYFHVHSADGRPSSFELTAWAYVSETTLSDSRLYQSNHESLLQMPSAASDLIVCQAGFGSLEVDYVTQDNGPIWIMGTPLFYEYTVGYDMKSLTIALESGECDACTASDPALLTTSSASKRKTGKPRRTHGAPRIPDIDVNMPL